MRVIVDADACPVKREIIRIATARAIPVVLVCNFHHVMQEEENVSVVVVDDAPDEADYEIANLVERGDVVVTQDIGLAAMIIEKGVAAISPRGKLYTSDNIMPLLEGRYLARQTMDRGHFPKGPGKFQPRDRSRFVQAFIQLLESMPPTADQ